MTTKKKIYSLVGVDSNAYAIMGYVCNAMRENGMAKSEVDTYLSEATSGDYGRLLAVSARMVERLNNK